MKPVAVTIAALAFGLYGTAAICQTASQSEPGLVGPFTGDPEKDSIGFILAGSGRTGAGCSGVPRFTSDAVQVGAPTGNPEKDSVGFLLLPGEDACAGAGGRDISRP